MNKAEEKEEIISPWMGKKIENRNIKMYKKNMFFQQPSNRHRFIRFNKFIMN